MKQFEYVDADSFIDIEEYVDPADKKKKRWRFNEGLVMLRWHPYF